MVMLGRSRRASSLSSSTSSSSSSNNCCVVFRLHKSQWVKNNNNDGVAVAWLMPHEFKKEIITSIFNVFSSTLFSVSRKSIYIQHMLDQWTSTSSYESHILVSEKYTFEFRITICWPLMYVAEGRGGACFCQQSLRLVSNFCDLLIATVYTNITLYKP